MAFFEEISQTQFALLVASALLTLVAAVALLLRVVPLRKHRRRCNADGTVSVDGLPRASVVVFARDDSEALAEMLPGLLSQDYAPGFEVIVVNDGGSPDVRHIVESMMYVHPNLYFTAAPDGARNLSRKKLALTLGVKAAKAPVVVHTTSSARITSPQWLGRIMRHFDSAGTVDVVIGYAAAPPRDDRAFGAQARAFDSAADALGWVAPAICGNPWRGSEHNLAYRSELFFQNKGFSRHLNLRDGDDDIFVSEIARGFNTAVELSDAAVVEVPGDNSRRALADRLGRRFFTKRFIPARPRLTGTLYTLAYFLAPWALAAAVLAGPLSTPFWIAAGIMAVIWLACGMLWVPALTDLHSRRTVLLTPLLAFTRPLRIAWRTVRAIISPGKRYTWE